MSYQNINVAGYNGINNLTVNGTLTTTELSTPGTLSTNTATRLAAAWGATGQLLQINPCTLKDTSSSGTVANVVASSIGVPTLNASSATTYTKASSLYIAGAPTAGTDVTTTNGYALDCEGAALIGGNLNFANQGGTGFANIYASGGSLWLGNGSFNINNIFTLPCNFYNGVTTTSRSAFSSMEILLIQQHGAQLEYL